MVRHGATASQCCWCVQTSPQLSGQHRHSSASPAAAPAAQPAAATPVAATPAAATPDANGSGEKHLGLKIKFKIKPVEAVEQPILLAAAPPSAAVPPASIVACEVSPPAFCVTLTVLIHSVDAVHLCFALMGLLVCIGPVGSF